MPQDKISAYRLFKVRGKSKKFRLQAIEKTKSGINWWKKSFQGEDNVKVRTKKVKGGYEIYTFFDKNAPKKKKK